MTGPSFFAVKNFGKFQHYRDRAPQWIKLYSSTLEDYDFAALPDVAKGHLMSIWLLAGRMDNKIPWDPQFIAAKIGARSPVDLDALFKAGFIIAYDADTANSQREDWPSRHVPDEVRVFVFARDENKCRRCGTTERLELDRIIPASQGGEGTAKNTQVLCVSCNRKKRAEQLRSAVSADASQLRSLASAATERMRSLEESREETEREKNRVPPAAAVIPQLPSEVLAAKLLEDADLKTRLFGDCLTWLAKLNGGDPKKYRGKIGQWIRDHGSGPTLEAMCVAQRAPPQGDVVAYIEVLLRGSHGKKHRPDEQVTGGAAMARMFADARARAAGGDSGDDGTPLPDDFRS